MTLLERCNSTEVSQVSNATGTPLDPILFHHFKTCSHRPPCQAPGLGSFLANVIQSKVNVRQRFVDFQCFCEGLWTKTMANHAKHENHEKFKRDLRQHTALSTTTQLKSTNSWSKDREQIWGNQGELQLKRCSYFHSLVRYINHYLSSFENALPIPLPSCFHPMFPCEGLLEGSTRTPLDCILLYHSETWSHRPPSQAPGLCSFIANVILEQVNLRQRFVDFQCFCKGLWTKPMSNHVKHENFQWGSQVCAAIRALLGT